MEASNIFVPKALNKPLFAAKHLAINLLESGLLVIKFDSPQKINQLTSAVMAEFEHILDYIEQNSEIKAVGILSAKPDSFLLGADLREIMQLKSHEAAVDLVLRGQKCFARFAGLKKPTIAAVHGICLGGGLELILCCHKRIASQSANTIMGLPETKLGFVPGLGGTQRLPRLIGLKNALDLILSAEPVDVDHAFEMKLIDKVVDRESLESEMEDIAKEMILSPSIVTVDEGYKSESILFTDREELILKTARRSMRMITRGNYPALTQVIDVIETGLKDGLVAGLKAEAKVFAQLAVSDISRNLVSLFFNSELIKQSALGAVEKESVAPIKIVGIVGGGMMGKSLAQYLAEKGYKILFRCAKRERTEQAFANIQDELQKNITRKNANGSANRKGEQAREIDITPVFEDEMFSQADLILEAIEEDLSAKIKLFKQLEPLIKADCLLGTITSSLSVTDIAAGLKAETTLAGVHFFHPVEKMPLVEVALPANNYLYKNNSEKRYHQANAKLLSFLAVLTKTPITVQDSPGFLVNRLLATYLLEAGRLAESGIPISWIDKAAVDFGMPLGPLTLLDEVGIDIALSTARRLATQSCERIVLSAVLDKIEAMGMKGKRFGCGIYMWDSNGKRLAVNPRLIEEVGLSESSNSVNETESAKIAAALILPMIDEAARCLEEKVVRRAREVDVGCVLGLGFPPFRGGVLKYADSLGLPQVVAKLNDIYGQSLPSRKVSNMLIELVNNNRSFY